MQRAVLVNSLRQLRKTRLDAFSRVYFGAEFCQNLIPDAEDVRNAAGILKRRSRELTFVTPPVTGRGLDKLELIFDYMNEDLPGSEVVVNDWGVLGLLRQRFPGLETVLGRLLTKQKRDPKAVDILFNRQKAKRIFNESAGRHMLMIPRQTPDSLLEHYRQSVINVKYFQGFLRSNNIKRVEVDNLLWGMDISMPKGMQVSIYFPYGYITTTRMCGLINLTYSRCDRQCDKFYLSYKYPWGNFKYYMRGNTVFYRSRPPSDRQLKGSGINRTVFQGSLPV